MKAACTVSFLFNEKAWLLTNTRFRCAYQPYLLPVLAPEVISKHTNAEKNSKRKPTTATPTKDKVATRASFKVIGNTIRNKAQEKARQRPCARGRRLSGRVPLPREHSRTKGSVSRRGHVRSQPASRRSTRHKPFKKWELVISNSAAKRSRI